MESKKRQIVVEPTEGNEQAPGSKRQRLAEPTPSGDAEEVKVENDDKPDTQPPELEAVDEGVAETKLKVSKGENNEQHQQEDPASVAGPVERGYDWLGQWTPMTHEPALPVGTGTGLVYDERMCQHHSLTDETHPESPMRIKAIYNMLVEKKLAERCVRVQPREATIEEICSVHGESYRQIVQAIDRLGENPLKALERVYDSIYLNKKSGIAAKISAGCTMEIVTQVVQGKLRNGVAVVRPPGHHAEQHSSKGFCFFNNVAIAAKIAVEKLNVKRVLIVDWDIHHGNGTQHMFEDDKRVFYFSIHRYDHGRFYPGSTDGGPKETGLHPAQGYNMNVGWNGGGMGDGDYIGLFHQLLLPVAYEFAPQLILISAGFDSARGDPLGGCDISPAGFAHMTHSLMAMAQGKVVLVLEGGYDLSAISHSFAACTAVLLGDPPQMIGRVFSSKRANRAIQDTKRYHAPYWTCCSHAGSDRNQFPLPDTNDFGGDEDEEEDDEDFSPSGQQPREGDEDEDVGEDGED